ncbi:MAG: DUF1302 family protein [Burkholderiaceae bacterium]|nr:DUF1302 family protein [Burkholderiaceae bacterium]
MDLIREGTRLRDASRTGRYTSVAVAIAAACAVASPAAAFEIDTGGETKIRWDNTFKYSNAWRVKGRSDALVADPTLDDGDRNFDKGLISNRVDWLTELDASYRNLGLRISAAAWYDTAYNRRNDNDSPFTANSFSVPFNRFTRDTRDLHGRDAEVLDAFVSGNFDIGGRRGNVKFGRHSLLYGESLFFGMNGIAAAQQPIDVIKALTVPNTQFKEIGRPVNQLSAQWQLTESVSVGGYYQLEWERTRIPAAGSYFSPADLVDVGAERIVAAAVPGVGPVASFYRTRDIEAQDSGQGGIQLRYRSTTLDTDFGFYAVRYHEKGFREYVRPGAGVGPGSPADKIGEYTLVFPEDIRAYGASASTSIGDANVAAEVSIRDNAPLVSLTMPDFTGTGDNDRNPLYAVGRTAHAQVSMIQLLTRSSLWDGAVFLGELAWNRTLSIKKNAAALDPNTSRDALGMRLVFEPQYFQVLDGVDISVPIGLGYTLSGKSSAVAGFGARHGGDFNIGIKGDYLKAWQFSLAYTHFLGSEAPIVIGGIKTFKQFNKDRNFVAFSLSRTF